MSLNTILDILEIPHIHEEIIQYLKTGDIVKCSLVCQQWYSFFNPTVWQKPGRPFKGQMETATLLKYQSHVRTIESPFIFQKISESLDFGWIFSNLRKISFDCYDPFQVQSTQEWFQWVRGINSLRELDIESYAFNPTIQVSLLSTLRSLIKLNSFKIFIPWNFKAEFPVSNKLEIMQACSRLESLDFIDMSPPLNSTGSGRIPIKPLEFNQKMNVKKLNIRFNSTTEESRILIPLLENCDNLKSLTLNSEFRPQIIPGVKRICRNGAFIKLEELQLNVLRDNSTIGILAILDAYKEAFDDKSQIMETAHGLRSFSLGNNMTFHEKHIVSISKLQHLTKIELIDTTRIDIKLFSELMHNIPTLISVQAAVQGNCHPYEGFFIRDGDEYKEWMCLDLEYLKILADRIFLYRTAGNCRLDNPYVFFFQQIGRLGKLRDFEITTVIHDILSIKRGGYLQYLSGLKQLRTFIFTCSEIRFRLEDAEWMLDNWPKLNFIHGVDCRLDPSFRFKMLQGRPHLTVI